MNIKVLLADDHAIVRDGLRLILDAQDDLRLVGEIRRNLDTTHARIQVNEDAAA